MKFTFEVSDAIKADLELFRIQNKIEKLEGGKRVIAPRYSTVAEMLTAMLSEAIAERITISAVVAIDTQIDVLTAQKAVASRAIVAYVPSELLPIERLVETS